MNPVAEATELIDVQALRVGMFVQLDGGWMSHPFPLSNFRIASQAQIDTIRSLGLVQVRWDRQRSAEPSAAEDDGPVRPALPGAAPLAGGHAAAADARPAARPSALTRQDDALRVCERQFNEASRDLKLATELAMSRPQEARAQAETLSTALVSKMLGEQELCVRLLNDTNGDRAAQHAMNVTVLSLLMGTSFGLPEAEMRDLGVGAMLHDIGKLDLPERLRHEDERHSASEAAVYREHVEHGLALARRMGLSASATQVIAQHHEHADGSGFPAGLNTDRMSSAARIVALVDRYDELCNPWLTARALTPHEALSQLFAQGRTRIDTSILGAFIKMMGVYPPGSTVQLTDDRYAMVVSVNASRPLKPRVLVYDAAVPREQAQVLDLEAAPGLGIRRSIRPQQLAPQALAYLSPRQRMVYFFEPAATADVVD
jgi:putative nucleotidyltransferase with HDIG domain